MMDKDQVPEINEAEQGEGVEPSSEEAGSELDMLRQDVASLKDRNVRILAEFENMRKRVERERTELIRYAHEEVIVEVLGFYEDFERTVAAARSNPAESAVLLKGVEMVYKRMQELLKKYDVSEVEALGRKFDHHCHEVLLAVDSSEHEDGQILEVFQKGYKLGDRVVRTAKVKVSRLPAESA